MSLASASVKLGKALAPRTARAPALTFEAVRKALKARGITVRANEWGEYRINYTGGREETAAYVARSHDRIETLEEVLAEGNTMADWLERERRASLPHAARLSASVAARKVEAPAPVAAPAKAAPAKAAPETRRYRMGSSGLAYAPGIVAWAINGYAFKKDRKRIEAVICEGWRIPVEHARQLLDKSVPYTLDGETVVFEVTL